MKLEIDIEARLAQFLDSLDQTASAATNAVGRMQGLFTGIGPTLATIGAGFSIGALVEKFNATVDSMAKLDDAAEQTGVSVESLSSLLNTLRPSGASIESITEIAGKLQRSMSGADQETSKAAEAFKALGIQTRDASGNLRGVDDVLTELADALNQYADGSNKVALVQAILGKAGAAAIPILKDLANTQREAASVTTEQAAEAERLQKAFAALKVQSEAFYQSLASLLIPKLADLVTAYKKAREAGMGLFDALDVAGPGFQSRAAQLQNEQKLLDNLKKQRDYFKAQTEAIGGRTTQDTSLDRQIAQQERKVDLLKNELGLEKARQDLTTAGLKNQEDRGFNPFDRQAPSLPTATKAKDALTDGERLIQQLVERLYTQQKVNAATQLELDLALGKYKEITPAEIERARALSKQIDALNEAADAEKKRGEVLKEMQQLQERQDEAGKREQEALEKTANAYRDLIDPTRAYIRELDEIERLRNIGAESGGLSDPEALAAAQKVGDKYARQASSAKEQTKELEDSAKKLGLTFQSAFEDAAISGKDLGSVLKGLAQDVLRIFLRQSVTTPLANGILGLFSAGASTADLSQPTTSFSTGGLVPLKKSAAVPMPAGVSVTQYNTIGSNLSRSEVEAGLAATQRSTLAAVEKSLSRNGALARV